MPVSAVVYLLQAHTDLPGERFHVLSARQVSNRVLQQEELVTHYLCGQCHFAWEVRSSQAEGRLTLGLAGPGPEYLRVFY